MAKGRKDMLTKPGGGMQVQLLRAYTSWLDEIGMLTGNVDVAALVAEFTSQRFDTYVRELRG